MGSSPDWVARSLIASIALMQRMAASELHAFINATTKNAGIDNMLGTISHSCPLGLVPARVIILCVDPDDLYFVLVVFVA